MIKTKAEQALEEASISVACLLDDIGVIESSELNLSELQKDIEHIQDQITILENHRAMFDLQEQGWQKMDTDHGHAWFGGKSHSALFDYLPQNIKENPHDFEDVDFLVCGWRKNSTDEGDE
mgnify:CR=1 FL=1|tara:strand:+ start:171 stop:533 length:363 start_codon:yes stop_codon:yes gene_type:complete